MFTNPTNIPRDGLLLECLLNGDPLDTSGNGNNGTATSLNYDLCSQGYVNKIASFNGNTSFINFISTSISTLLNGTNHFSISLLVKLNTLTAGQIVLDTRGSDYNGFFIEMDSSGKFKTVRSDGSVADTLCISTNAKTTGTWCNLIITYDGNNGKMYENLVEQTGGTSTRTLNSNGDFKIGKGFAGNTSFGFLNGFIGLVRIYDRILSQSERMSLYISSLRKLGPNYALQYPELFEGCVGYWDFRGDSSNLIDGISGTVNGATLTTDHLGNANSAYNFDGNDYISMGSQTILNNTGDFTIEGIFKINSTSMSYGQLFLQEKLSTTQHGKAIAINGTTLYFLNSNNTAWVSSSVTLNTTDWYYFAYVFDSTTGGTMYINGVAYGTTTQIGTFTNSTGVNQTNFGYRNGANYFDGILSYFKTSNRIITENEIKLKNQILNKKYIYPFPKYTPASLPKPLFHIDGTNNGTTWYDKSGNGNHFTQSGGVTSGRILQSKYSIFDGVDNKLVLSQFNPNSDTVTILSRVRSDIAQANADYNLIYRWSDGASEGDIAIYYSGYGANNLRAWARQSSGADAFVINYAKTIPTTKYQTFAQVIDNTNDIMKLYHNGVLVGTHSTTLNAQMNIANDFVIGGRNWGGEENFDGNIAEVLCFDEALSDKQIEEWHYSNFIF